MISSAKSPTLKNIAADIKKAEVQACAAARHGRIQPLPGSLRLTFGKIKGFPELHVLDSTDPAQIKALQAKLDLEEHDLHRLQQVGKHARAEHLQAIFLRAGAARRSATEEVGNRFIAITDPGSKMQKVAEGDHFRKVFFGVPSIGGRYSALSDFGMVPGAVMGIDIPKFLKITHEMVEGLRLGRRCRQESRRDRLARFSAPRPSSRPRQSHDHRVARHSRPWRVARTASRRIHRQNRQGHHPGRPRNARASRMSTATIASSPISV